MNDSAVISSATSEAIDQITQHLVAITEASAGCQCVMIQNKSLAEFASQMLQNQLDSSRSDSGLAVSNPNAIFFNRLDDDGQLYSISTTALLIEAARHGVSVLEKPGAFYTRHDSVDPDNSLTDAQARRLFNILTEAAYRLIAAYEEHLSEHWQMSLSPPADLKRVEPATDLLIEQKRTALQSELVLCGFSRKASPVEQARLTRVIADDSTDGVFALSWMSDDKTLVAVPSVYVVSESQNDAEPAGVVFLIMPSCGVERFDSVEKLRATLSGRVSGPNVDQDLLQLMLLSAQARLSDGETVEPHAWVFTGLQDPLLNAHIQAVQHKQKEDLHYLLQHKASDVDSAIFHSELERIRVCSHVDDAMGRRFSRLTAEMDELVQPHWRKYNDPEKKEHLRLLESTHRTRKKKVEELLKGTESIETFANNEMIDYIHRHLGCLIEPESVELTLKDSVRLGTGDDLQMTYRKSLLGFAVHGLPDVDHEMEISPAPAQLHAAFSDSFVRTMISDLNLHQRYESVLRERYTDEETLRAMTHHRDSAITLGAWASLMQGHLVQDRSHQLLHAIRCDDSRDGIEYNIGSLYLTQTHTRFKDLIVFEEITQADEHYVLYAPGAPTGRDLFEFGSWRQLCAQVGKWLATDSGLAYVHDQLAGPGEGHGERALLTEIQLKPSLWRPDSCIVVRSTRDNYESKLADLVSQRAWRAVDAIQEALPSFNHQMPYATPSILALMEARADALNLEFARLSPGLISLRDFVRTQTSRLFNEFLRGQGFGRTIDPDTLYVGLGLPYLDTPDFSQYSELRSLTDLMLDGGEDILSYRPSIHLYSSTGLDVTKLPREFIPFMDRQIREADLGARYMDFLTKEFLGRQNPSHERRKAVMATRIQYDMLRHALKSLLYGRLSEAQYSWLRFTIAGLDPIASRWQLNTTSSVSVFKIADQIVEGVYIFRDFNRNDPDYNVLYTPESPDGLSYRPVTDYADLLRSPAMRHYYHERVAYVGKGRVAEFFDDLHRGKKSEPDDVRVMNRPESRIIDVHHLYGDMIERMIADTDSQIESVGEKRLALAWTIIQWTGTILLMPFPSLSFGWGLVTTSMTFFHAFEAYAVGDRATALPLLLFGVLGVVSGGDGVRAFVAGGSSLAKGLATRTGLWAWDKLELGRSFYAPA